MFDAKACYTMCRPCLHHKDQSHMMGWERGWGVGVGGGGGSWRIDCFAMTGPHLAARWATVYQQLAQLDNVCGRNWFSDLAPVAFFGRRVRRVFHASRTGKESGQCCWGVGPQSSRPPDPGPNSSHSCHWRGYSRDCVSGRGQWIPRTTHPPWRMLRGHLATVGFLPRRRCPMRLLTLVQAMSLSEVSGIHRHLLVPRRLLLFSLPHRGRRLRLAGILPRPSHLPTYPLCRTHGKPFIRHGEHRSLDVIWLGG